MKLTGLVGEMCRKCRVGGDKSVRIVSFIPVDNYAERVEPYLDALASILD